MRKRHRDRGGSQAVRTGLGEPVAAIMGGPAYQPGLYIMLFRHVFEAWRMHGRCERAKHICGRLGACTDSVQLANGW